MRRATLLAALALMMMLGMAPSASADVHGVSQAQCAAEGVQSGAIASRHAVDMGRPGAPIPVTASDGRTEGPGGAAPANGTNC
ncbi:MAG: hypothetical protein GEU74_08160 [Nitriliruptorales bacterium]|nr:hypothetical protein [Nitriliruptorales bacterium]